jgi:hypothetical protein
MKRIVSIVGSVALMAGSALAQPSNVYLVDASASGANDGSSWGNAFTGVQSAIDAALASGGTKDEVWVKAGTYHPTKSRTMTSGSTTITVKTFDVNGNVSVFGGFAGTETARSQRDISANVTTLAAATSGAEPLQLARIGGNARIDGFTLTGVAPPSVGANWFPVAATLAASGALSNCRITGNTFSVGNPEASYGAGVLLLTGYPAVTSCRIDSNVGRAVLGVLGTVDNTIIENNVSQAGSPTLYGPDDLVTLLGISRLFGCTVRNNGTSGVRYSHLVRQDALSRTARTSFTGNFASNALIGGAFINVLAKDNVAGGVVFGLAGLYNCTVMNNDGRGAGGCLGSNNILWGNGAGGGSGSGHSYSDQQNNSEFVFTTTQFWTSGNGGLGDNGDDPLLDSNGRLQNGSPAIDTGSNALHPDGVVRDLDGNVRFFGTSAPPAGQGEPPVIDRGCFEFGAFGNGAWCYADFNGDAALNATDFVRFIQLYNIGHPLANCDGSSVPPKDNAADLTCFVLKYQAGCP